MIANPTNNIGFSFFSLSDASNVFFFVGVGSNVGGGWYLFVGHVVLSKDASTI